MCTWLNHRKRLTVGVALGIVGLVVLAGRSPTLAGGGTDQTEGFVLLSMEQAARYRGSQMPLCCTATVNYTICSGSNAVCSWWTTQAGCESSDVLRWHPQTMPTYCGGWTPCGQTGGCNVTGPTTCYVWEACVWNAVLARCQAGQTGTCVVQNEVCLAAPTPVNPPQQNP